MTDATQALHDLVLEAMANGYESFECVLEQVLPWASQRGIKAARSDVAKGLEWAIREGYAKAYLLSAQPPHSQPVAFSRERLDDLWYYVTPNGMQRVEQLEREPNGQ